MPELRSAPQISTQSPSSYLAPGVHLLKPSRSEWNWNGVAHLRAKLGKNLRKRQNIQYNIYPPPRWFRMQLKPLRHSETLKKYICATKRWKTTEYMQISNSVLTHMYMVCERWLSVLQKQGVLFFFFPLREEMYSFYIHSCWPFIEVGFFCFIGRPRARQEGFLLGTENPNKLCS